MDDKQGRKKVRLLLGVDPRVAMIFAAHLRDIRRPHVWEVGDGRTQGSSLL